MVYMKIVIKMGFEVSIILSFLMATVCVFPSQALGGLWTSGGEMRGRLPGDCNGDGKVTGDEVEEARDTFLNPTPDNLPCRDFDTDGLFSIDELMLVINSFLEIDRDSDGMLDSWEVVHGLDLSRNDANEDPDGDGFANLKEFNAHTDPQDSASSSSGTVKGIITDASTGDPIQAATVMADGLSATTNSSGEYIITNVPAGSQTVTASKSGYQSSSQTVAMTATATVTADFALTPLIGEEEAIQILINEVIKPDSIDHNLIAFKLREHLKPGDEVVPYYTPESMHIAQNEEWFFWIDDDLLAQYAHRNRYVYIDCVTGNVTFTEEEWWPVLNGKALWVVDEEYWDSGNWAYSTVELAAPGPSGGSSGFSQFRRSPTLSTDEAGGNAVLIVDGWDGKEPNPNNGFETDADGMHDALSSVTGIDVTHYGPSEDGNPDRDGEASVDAIRRWLERKAGEMKACETLTLYITSHGGTDFIMIDGERLRANNLRQWLRQFDPGVHIIVILQGCRTGSFIDNFHEMADLIITATNSDKSSYFDSDPRLFKTWLGESLKDPNPDDEGSEFTSGLVEDINQIIQDPAKLRQIHETAERLEKPFWVVFFEHAFVTALEKDATAKNSHSFPKAVLRSVESITLTPPTAENLVFSDHEVTATVKNIDDEPVAGLRVRFTVTGVNPNIGTATTDARGQAKFTYHGAETGEDNISAKSWGKEAKAAKTWVIGEPASITLYPEDAIHMVGTQAFVTATVVDKRDKPVPGVEVEFKVTGLHSTSGVKVTDANGQARFSYTGGEKPGTDTITAKADEVEAKTTKIWVEGPSANMTLEPKEDINAVGTEHTVTATIQDKYGNPVSHVTVKFTVTGANSTGGSSTTDDKGEAKFSYTGEKAGMDTIKAQWPADDPIHPEGLLHDTATKIWVAPGSVALVPEEATNPVGTEHTITATVLCGMGNPLPGATVNFKVTGANSADDSIVTDANGQARFSYNGKKAGMDKITVNVKGLEPVDAYKNWVAE
jgi:hypothetical protein